MGLVFQHIFYLYSKRFQLFEAILSRTKSDVAVIGKTILAATERAYKSVEIDILLSE